MNAILGNARVAGNAEGAEPASGSAEGPVVRP